MAKRKAIPQATQDELLMRCARRCCLCFGLNADFEEKSGQIAHLDHDASNDDIDNLAWLCLEHHDQYDGRTSQSKGLTMGEIRRYRAELYQAVDRMREGIALGQSPAPARRPIYALAGLLVGAAVDVLINLLAAALQQQTFGDRFSQGAIWWLAGLAALGLLAGYWLAGSVPVPISAPVPQQPASGGVVHTVSITRLRALLSYAKLRGRGINLGDILLVGSRIDIDTRD
jgi:hypothetical protein